jgi:molybdate/tungstate transport system permease protein
MLFVSAPLYISGAREAFARVDPRYEAVARTLGDDAWRSFRRVTLPLSRRGMVAASVVMWARAVSEFGAIVILAYNPKVASILSVDRLTTFGLDEALPVAGVMAVLALIPLTVLRALRHDHSVTALP